MSNQRFYLKPNFGHWSIIDKNNNSVVTGYSKKTDAETTASGLNKLKTIKGIDSRIKSLKTIAGYGYFITKKVKQ